MYRSIVPSLLFALVFGLACDRTHPAEATVRGFLDAVQYGDVDGALRTHIDSSKHSDWCRAEFSAALKKAQSSADEDECRRVRGLGEKDLDSLPDELRLAVQITGWACVNREGTCEDYAETVFRQTWSGHPLVTGKPTRYEIRKVFGEGDRAVAYVDLRMSDGSSRHRTFELRRDADVWRVSSGFMSEEP